MKIQSVFPCILLISFIAEYLFLKQAKLKQIKAKTKQINKAQVGKWLKGILGAVVFHLRVSLLVVLNKCHTLTMTSPVRVRACYMLSCWDYFLPIPVCLCFEVAFLVDQKPYLGILGGPALVLLSASLREPPISGHRVL